MIGRLLVGFIVLIVAIVILVGGVDLSGLTPVLLCGGGLLFVGWFVSPFLRSSRPKSSNSGDPDLWSSGDRFLYNSVRVNTDTGQAVVGTEKGRTFLVDVADGSFQEIDGNGKQKGDKIYASPGSPAPLKEMANHMKRKVERSR